MKLRELQSLQEQLNTCNTQLTSFTSQQAEMTGCTAINGIVTCIAEPECTPSCVANTVLALYS
jgi:hypothetical protein